MKSVYEKWNSHTRVYDLGNNKFRAEFQEGQNYFNRQAGRFEEADLNLKREANWEFEYAVRQNSFAAFFNDTTDQINPTLAGVEIINKNGAARWINYKIHGATPTSIEAAGNKVVYRDCWPGVTCEYIITPEKLKFNVIYATRQSVREVEITFKESAGIKRRNESDGNITFTDRDTGETLWRIESPFMVEHGKKLRRVNRNVRHQTGLKRTVKGKQYDGMVFKIDDLQWLDSAAYPVTLDPTTVFQPPGKDNFLDKAFPNTPDTLNSNMLYMTNTSSTNVTRALVNFDISTLPANISIQTAWLDLFWYEQWGSKNKTLYYSAYRCTRSDWVELEVCWNNYKNGFAWTTPGGDYTTTNGRTISFSSSVDYPNGWIYWDVTGIVNDVRNGGGTSVNILVKNYYEGTQNTGDQFYYAKDSTQVNYRPKLTIEYVNVINGSFTANATVVKSYTTSYTANAALKKTVSPTFNSYGVIKKNGISQNFTADAVGRKTISGFFNSDAAFNKQTVITITADAIFKKTSEAILNSNTVLKKSNISGNVTADALIIKAVIKTVNVNSVLKILSKINSFTASAALRGENTSVFFDQIFLDLTVTSKFNLTVTVTRSVSWEVSTIT